MFLYGCLCGLDVVLVYWLNYYYVIYLEIVDCLFLVNVYSWNWVVIDSCFVCR